METLFAFVAHSFSTKDQEVVRTYLEFLKRIAQMDKGFSWDHAETAEPKDLPVKVLSKMEGKNLLIAICTPSESAISPENISSVFLRPPYLKARKEHFQPKISDWILQEIGCAVGKGMRIIILLEEGVRVPGGLQGDIEYITFTRQRPEASFNRILEMLESLTAPLHSPTYRNRFGRNH